MLELRNISLCLAQNDRQLIENFNFTLNRGDKAVIIGEEGNGKSTLLKLIHDRRSVENYCICDGSIVGKGTIAYLPQTFPEDLAQSTVSAFFAGTDIQLQPDISAQLTIPTTLFSSDQLIKTLSGGEKIKIQLAKILMERPDILLLDEPTNDLDLQTLQWMEKFIRKSPLPMLFVSHDESLIENAANVIIHIEQLDRKTKCRITVTHAKYSAYIQSRRQSFQKQMQVAKKQRSDYNAQMERWTQIYNRVDHEQRTISRADPGGGRLLKKKMKSVISQEKRFQRQAEDFLDFPQTEEAVLTRFDRDITLPSGKTILDFKLDQLQIAGKILAKNIRLTVIGSQHIGIFGKNGAGKSTLLAQIWTALKDRPDLISCYMPQDYTQKLNYAQTPVEFLAANYTRDEITQARTYLGSMRFTHAEMTGKIGALSGGQKAKILFLDMVIRRANVLVLDEPTRNFSPLSSPVIRQTLSDFGGAIISVSHDRKYLSEVCQKVFELTPEGLLLQKSFPDGSNA